MRRKRIPSKWLAPALLAALFPLTACDGSDAGGPGDRTASLSVFLTDTPGEVESVWVKIGAITLRSAQGGQAETLGSSEGWVVLTDLVGATQLLAPAVPLEAGRYGEIRLQVENAVLRTEEGMVYIQNKEDQNLPPDVDPETALDLQCPSCSQSGLKVKFPNGQMDLPPGESKLILDFDVAQSFGHEAGSSGQWAMHPVIHGTLTEASEVTFDINGSVVLGGTFAAPPCPPVEGVEGGFLRFFVPVITLKGFLDGDGNAIQRQTETNADGSFGFHFIPQGAYLMGFSSEVPIGEGSHLLAFTANPDQAEVTLGTELPPAVVTYTITNVTCEPIDP